MGETWLYMSHKFASQSVSMSDLPVCLCLWLAICPCLPSSFLEHPSAWRWHLPSSHFIYIIRTWTDTHAHMQYRWIQIYSIPLPGSKNNQPHTRAPATSLSLRLTQKPSNSLKYTWTHTQTHNTTVNKW